MRLCRLEIGIGARRLSAADHGLLVSLSIGDLKGTAYWLAR
jgi:hypothetical protein